MRDDIHEAFIALRQSIVDSKEAVDRVAVSPLLDEDDRLAMQRTAKRLSISIIALDDIKNELKKS